MTSIKHIKNIKKIFTEAENQFTSKQSTPLPNKDEQSEVLVSPAIETNPIEGAEEEKGRLTAKILQKIKQSLEVSDEVQSLLNEIYKLNKNIDANTWELNTKENTAYLPSKNAQIFKQNNFLCLSYNNKIELFKSVHELHDFLKKHNLPLPKNIKLHEAKSDKTPALFDLKAELDKYIQKIEAEKAIELNKKYPERQDKTSAFDDLTLKKKEQLYFTPHRMSREQARMANKMDEPDSINDGKGHLFLKDPNGGWIEHDTKKKTECGITVGGSLGSAVQYTANKPLDEEEDPLQEFVPTDKGWLPGVIVDTRTGEPVQYSTGMKPDMLKGQHDWSTHRYTRADRLVTIWFKWVSEKLRGQKTQFYPDRDPNFEANAHTFIKAKHADPVLAQRRGTSWNDFWENKLDKNLFLDEYNTQPNPHYGALNITREELENIVNDFKAKGLGNILGTLDINDPDILNKFQPISVYRPKVFNTPEFEKLVPNQSDSKYFRTTTVPAEIRDHYFDMISQGERRQRTSGEDELLNFLASRYNTSPEELLQTILDPEKNKLKYRKYVQPSSTANTPAIQVPKGNSTLINNVSPFLQNEDLKAFYTTWIDNLSHSPDPDIEKHFIKAVQDKSLEYKNNPQLWKSLINGFIKQGADDQSEVAFDSATLSALATLRNLHTESTSQTSKDIALKEDDTPADFATGGAEIAQNVTDALNTASPGTETATTITTPDTTDYTTDPSMNPTNGLPQGVSFDDINITSGGDYAPVDPNQNMPTPTPDEPEYKIISVLVDENDPTKIQVKVKDKETGEITTKDLSEIDV